MFRTEPPTLDWPSAEPLDGRGPAVADPPGWRIERDVIGRSTTVRVHDGGEDIVPDGRRLYVAESLRMTAWDDDPARAELEAHVVYRWQEVEPARDGEVQRPASTSVIPIEIRAHCQQTSDTTDFDLHIDLEVDLDGERFFERTWHERIPRQSV